MNRRSFTLIETVLAAVLASVVVLGCMSAFFALSRTDKTLSARFYEANDLARIQRTMQRAFTSLVLSPNASLDEEETDGLLAESETGDAAVDENGELIADELTPRARIILEPDLDPMLTSMLRRSRYAAGGGGSSVAVPQRLELVLSSVPIRPPSVQSTAWASALVGVDDLAEEQADGQEEYTGVRGAFVLRPDDQASTQTLSRQSRGDDRIGWSLWWQPLDGRSDPARVASGLAACHFQMFFGREMLDSLTAHSTTAMPTYIKVEVETLTGLYADYLFEVVWTVDALVEDEAAETNTTTNTGGGAAAGGGRGGNRAGDGRGGGRQGERDPRARPNPNRPQGTRPGQQVDGQPRRLQPPGRPADGQQRPNGSQPTGPGGGGGGGGRTGGDS